MRIWMAECILIQILRIVNVNAEGSSWLALAVTSQPQDSEAHVSALLILPDAQ